MSRNTIFMTVGTLVILIVGGGVFYHQQAQAHQSGGTWGLPPPSVVQQMSPAKQKVVQSVAQQQIAAGNRPAATKVPYQMPTSCPTTMSPEILTAQYTPSGGPVQANVTINGIAYVINNGAIFEDSAQHGFQVSAGALASNPAQGVMIVFSINLDQCDQSFKYTTTVSLTPTLHGTLTITRVNNDLVAFTTSQGEKGTFDVLTGAFQ